MKLWNREKRQQEAYERDELDFEEEYQEEPGEEEEAPKERKALKVLRTVGARGKRFVKKHKLLTVFLILLLIAAIVAVTLWQKRSNMPQMQQPTVETATVERMDLTNSISVTGTLATAEGKTGSTTLKDITVTKVYVEVGDEVQEGDIICTFDSSDIESALADARNNYAVNQQLDALENYETQYQDTISDAEDSLQEARDTRDAYKNAYENAAASEEEALAKLNEVKSQNPVESLKTAYEEAAKNLEEKIEGEENIVITDLASFLSSRTDISDTYAAEYKAYTDAQSAYESAEKAISDAETSYQQAQSSTSSAYSAYEQAQSARESAQDQYEDTIEQAQETYDRAKLQDQLVTEDDDLNKIEDYEEQLEDCTVYAAMSGTITALNVDENNVFEGGTIYEIQDVHNFIVEATVDEYDVVDIEEGQTAYIKTDSLGDEELEGEVTYVSPVGTSGQTMGSASGTASYEIQITINEPQEKLRSGMTASVSIALEESKDTLAVPYDCVQTNEAGESVIYVDDNGERKEVVVETGIETDYYIEVKSDEISEGTTVYLSTPLLQGGTTGGSDAVTSEDGAISFDFGGGGGGGMGGGMPSGGGPSGGGAPGGF